MKRAHLPPPTTLSPSVLSHQPPTATPLPRLWNHLDQSRQRQIAQLLAQLIRRIRRPATNVVKEMSDEQP